MAVHKAAKKSVRQEKKIRERNRMLKSKMKTVRKKLENALEKNDKNLLESLFKDYVSVVDRAASKGVIHKKNAARRKIKMAQKLGSVGLSQSSINDE